MPKLINLIGKRFGRLIVIQKAANNRHGKSMWLCLCDCETEKIVYGYSLERGDTKSCGCLRKENTRQRSIRHGHTWANSVSKIYDSWRNMIQRCTNPNKKDYCNYGGRGITVCKHWMKFENFLEDMGECPSGHSIDRIDNNGNYCKSNCQWATSKEQNRNSRHNRLVTYMNKTQCITEWSEEIGISENIIRWRLNHGWSTKQALTEPVGLRSCKGVS